MIGTIRKHSTWLWAIVITVVVITFVWWGTPGDRGRGDSRASGNFGSISGQRVTREEFAAAQEEFFLQYFFNTGDWPDGRNRLSEFEIQRETYFRIFLVRKLQELDIHASSDDIAKAASDTLRNLNRGNPVPLENFANQVLRQKGMSADDFARFVRHNLGIQQLISLTGLGGEFVTPQELRSLYEREHEEISAQAVFFSASNHLDEVTVTPEAVAQFYTNQTNDYYLPDRVQVTYVEFPASNFLSEAELEIAQIPKLTELIEAKYQEMGGTNFFREAKSPDEAKKIIRDEEVKRLALVSARKKANEFANALFAIGPVSADNLGKLAAQKGLAAHLSKPFDRNFPPDDLKVRADFVRKAFTLTPEEPFSEALVGEDAVYVTSFAKKIPSHVPPLEDIRQRVTDDYKLFRARSIARQAGTTFVATLAAGLPNGKSFLTICAETKVHPVSLPPFSLSTESLPAFEGHADLSVLKRAAFNTPVGKSSDFQNTDQGGFVAFVQSKFPIDQGKMAADLPRFEAAVRRTRQTEAFYDWFRKESERALRDTPALRQPSPPAAQER